MRKKLFFSISVLSLALFFQACDNNARRVGRGTRGLQQRQLQNTRPESAAFLGKGRHALALLKRNGKSTNPFDYGTTGSTNPNGGGIYGGPPTGSTGTGGSSGGPVYGGAQGNTNGFGNTSVSGGVGTLPGLYGQSVGGLHVLRMYNNGSNGINPYLYQGRDTGRSISLRVEADSHVALTTDGSGWAVSLPSEGNVLVGEFSKEGELYQRYKIPFRNPSILESMRTVSGEIMAVVHDNNQVGFLLVTLNGQGRLEFIRLRYGFKPTGLTSKITAARFSPGGKYIYFSTATNPNAPNIGGELVVCDIPTILSRPQDPQRAAAENVVYGTGCFPGDPGLGYNQGSGQHGQLSPITNPSFIGTQRLHFVPDGLIVNWDMVGAWNSVRGAYVLVPPNTGEHNANLSMKLGIVGPTEVVQYVPYNLGNTQSQGVFGYQFKYAIAHPRNNNIILFGNKQSSTESFVRVLSTENMVNMGRELDLYPLGSGLITSVEQDIGELNSDYTPTLNGEFVLVGRDTGVIHVMSYVEDYKSLTHNGPLYDIPVYGFDTVDMAIRTSTPFISTQIPLDELLPEDKEQPVS